MKRIFLVIFLLTSFSYSQEMMRNKYTDLTQSLISVVSTFANSFSWSSGAMHGTFSYASITSGNLTGATDTTKVLKYLPDTTYNYTWFTRQPIIGFVDPASGTVTTLQAGSSSEYGVILYHASQDEGFWIFTGGLTTTDQYANISVAKVFATNTISGNIFSITTGDIALLSIDS